MNKTYQLIIFDWEGTLATGIDAAYPGVKEMLISLKGKGYFLAVATTCSRMNLNFAIKNIGLQDIFDVTRCGDECFSKPHPQMLLEIMDQLGVAAKDAVMVGDSYCDIEMGKNASMDAIGVGTNQQYIQQLLLNGALCSAASVCELDF